MSSVNMEADLEGHLQDLDEILGGKQGTCNRYPLSLILEILGLFQTSCYCRAELK